MKTTLILAALTAAVAADEVTPPQCSGGHIICGYELTWSDGKRFSYEDRKEYLANNGSYPVCDTQGWNAECDNLVTHGLWQCNNNAPITFFKSCPKKPNTSEGPCKRQNTDNSGNSRCY